MRFYFTLAFILASACLWPQAWIKKLYHSPQPYHDQFSSTAQLKDSSVILVGKTAVNNFYRLLIHKLDKFGNSQWSKVDSGLVPGWPTVCATADGDFIVALNVHEPDIPSQTRVIKLSSEGDVRWTRDIGEWNSSGVNKAIADEHHIYLTGSATKKESWETDLVLASLSYDGDLQWSYTYDVNANEIGVHLELLPGRKIFVSGIDHCAESECDDRWFMMSVDTSGSIITASFLYTGTYHWIGINDVAVTNDKRIFLSGGYSARPVIVELDETLSPVEATRYVKDQESGYIGSMLITPDNSLLISGSWGSQRTLMKRNSNGSVDWIRSYGCPEQIFSGGGPLIFLAGNKILQYTSMNYSFTALSFLNEDGSVPGSSYLQLNEEPVTLQISPAHFIRSAWGEIRNKQTILSSYTVTEVFVCCERPSISGPGTVCSGDQVTLSVTGGTAIKWNTGEQNPTISFMAYCNNYFIADISTDCGLARDTLFMEVILPPQAPATADTTVCTGSSAELTASGNGEVKWYNAKNEVLHNGAVLAFPSGVPETQTFYATAGVNGCESEKNPATIYVTTNCSEDLPTSSSPLNAYPNPFSTTSTLRCSLVNKTVVSLDIYTSSNLLVSSIERLLDNGEYTFEIGNELVPGIYFIRMKFNGETHTIKVVKTEN